MTKVKICGVRTVEELRYINEARPDFVGFVMAPSKRKVTIPMVRNLRHQLDDGISAVGVFSGQPVEMIIELLDEEVFDMVQLHGNVPSGYIRSLKEASPATVVQAIDMNAVGFAPTLGTEADMLLLDGGPGGTGVSFDWSSAHGVQNDFFLAGGLDLQNVRQAIEAVRPFAVDISSGVEVDGRKDRTRILHTVRRIRDV